MQPTLPRIDCNRPCVTELPRNFPELSFPFLCYGLLLYFNVKNTHIYLVSFLLLHRLWCGDSFCSLVHTAADIARDFYENHLDGLYSERIHLPGLVVMLLLLAVVVPMMIGYMKNKVKVLLLFSSREEAYASDRSLLLGGRKDDVDNKLERDWCRFIDTRLGLATLMRYMKFT